MIEIARILKAQGISGEVKVQVFSDNADDFINRGYAYVKQGGGMIKTAFAAVRQEPPFVYLRIEGVTTRNEAENLRGVLLYIDKSELPEPDEGEYFIFDLIGLEVKDTNGNRLGALKDVLQHGAADVYVVKGEKNFMFPALKRVIRSVDISSGVMLVDSAALAEVAVYDDI
jgi:16S rRNA processing protein RimM